MFMKVASAKMENPALERANEQPRRRIEWIFAAEGTILSNSTVEKSRNGYAKDMVFNLGAALARKKTTDDNEVSKLSRCLTLLDLSMLGIGGTLGLGVYVLAGSVARNEAGPAVCLSFLVAAVASAFAGLCYAEFASRVPKAGSAYVYSYVTVGEFVAYVIGWNLILEYVIGTASVARGLSNYVDQLANNTMRTTLTSIFPIDIDFLSEYPDFLSAGLVMVLTVLLAIGVKESTGLNNLFTVLNLATVCIVLVAGSLKADPHNWRLTKEEVQDYPNAGSGGFLPFGVAGVMAGAAKCFFGFVGFDAVATTGEEAKNPQRNIPLAIVISLIVIFLAYFGISTVLTLMWPYYDQDPEAPFPYVFRQVNWPIIMWIVTIGAIFALCTSMLGAMFPLPRIIYAMAKDGLLFNFLSNVNPWSKTPIYATITSGILSGTMATIFNLHQLIDMMSIGTLLAYTMVAVCVLILRYQPEDNYELANLELHENKRDLDQSVLSSLAVTFNFNMNKFPDERTSNITRYAVSIFAIFSAILCAFVIHGSDFIQVDQPFYLGLFVFVSLILFLIIVIIARQPTADVQLAFKVPWVPVIPCLSVLINIYLMLELDLQTWIRFCVWLLVGFIIYFAYGIRHSKAKVVQSKPISKRNSSAATASVHSEKKDSHDSENTKF